MWLFFQKADERARPWQSYVKVVDPALGAARNHPDVLDRAAL
jgi:hypothetical protein